MSTLHNHKSALITGSSSGLGRSLQVKLEAAGVKVFAPKRQDGYDLCKKDDLEKILAFIKKEKPDLVINCAGIGLYGNAVDSSLEEQRELLQLNMNALADITLQAATALVSANQSGVIVNISSGVSFAPWPGLAAYAASKSFVTNYSQALDYELKPKGVRVLTSCPGMFSSAFSAKAAKGKIRSRSPLLITSPDRIANEILKQIKAGKSLSVPTLRYKILLGISHLLPNRWKIPILAKAMRSSWDAH